MACLQASDNCSNCNRRPMSAIETQKFLQGEYSVGDVKNHNEIKSTRVVYSENEKKSLVLLEMSNQSSSNNTTSSPEHSQEGAGSFDPKEDEILRYGAKHVIMLFTPVSICMALVVVIISSIDFYTQKGVYFIYTPFEREGPTPLDVGSKLWMSIMNTVILLSVVIVLTFVLFLLYKARCYKVIAGWLLLSSLMLLFIFSFMFLGELLRLFNFPLDFVTVGVIIWNFAVVGIICIHWIGPLLLQQAYLIFVSALVALTFIKYLPDWTTWVLLAGVSIWDFVAVLAPKGPLRRLVELAHERNEPIFPALIYSTTMAWSVSEASAGNEAGDRGEDDNNDDGDIGDDDGNANNANEGPVEGDVAAETNVEADGAVHISEGAQGNEELEHQPVANRPKIKKKMKKKEDSGVKLGLGDFIFYSILVGKASTTGDWNTTVACFIAILIGLCFTLLLLAISRKALPALPISITFGLVFYFATSQLVQPFMTMCTYNQIFI